LSRRSGSTAPGHKHNTTRKFYS